MTVTTTIGLPITASKEDQRLLKTINRLMKKRGYRTRTGLLRCLINEENARCRQK